MKAILKSIPLLSKLNENDIESLASLLNENSFEAGTNIITEGDEGDKMFILIEGNVDIIKTTVFGDKFVCASLSSDTHAVFGEMAMIDSDKRSATVYAKTKCKALSISKENFMSFCNTKPEAGVTLLTMISQNLVRNIRKENENLKLVYQALIEEIEAN